MLPVASSTVPYILHTVSVPLLLLLSNIYYFQVGLLLGRSDSIVVICCFCICHGHGHHHHPLSLLPLFTNGCIIVVVVLCLLLQLLLLLFRCRCHNYSSSSRPSPLFANRRCSQVLILRAIEDNTDDDREDDVRFAVATKYCCCCTYSCQCYRHLSCSCPSLRYHCS